MASLAEFLKEKRSLPSRIKRGKEELLKEWQRALSKLFSNIESWVAPAISEGLELKKGEVEIDEEELGKYIAPTLELEFEGIRVKIEPVGRLVVGARGRVDVNSPLGVCHLVRLGPDEDEWYLVCDSIEAKKPLNKQIFEDLLKEIFDLV